MTKKEKHKNIHTGTTNGGKLVEKKPCDDISWPEVM
jgi:hypothetical protein